MVAEEVLSPFPPSRRLVWIAAAVVAGVYLLGVTNAWWPTPDSALYQGLGRELVRTGEYRFNGQRETIVTPGLPAILGALWWAFGEGFWAPNLFMTLCGLGALWLAWRTLLRRTSRRMAFAVVLATAATYRYYDYTHLILTDAPFVLLFWLSAYGCLRVLEGAWAWAGVVVLAVAAAVAIRPPGVLVLGPWGVALVLDRATTRNWPRRLVAGALAAGTAAIVARTLLAFFPGYVEASGRRFSVLGRLWGIVVGLSRLPDELNNTFLAQRSPWLVPVGAGIVALMLIGGIVLWRRGRRLAPATFAADFLAVCFLVGYRSVRARYLMALYPLLLLMVFEGLFWSVRRLLLWRARAARPLTFLKAATVLTALLVAVNIPKLLRHAAYYSTMGRLGRYHEVIEGGIYAELAPTAAFLRERFGTEAVVAVRPDRVTMLHLLGGARTRPFKKVCLWNPWNAEHAEEIFADFQTRRDVRAVVFDRGELDKRFVRRMRSLLDAAPNLRCIHEGRYVRIYERVRPPASRPAEPSSARGGGCL